jgi:uncharacterized protein YndB with AHSA1/START domain
MTRQSSFKRIVRARMEKTGESYTAARASLLAATDAAEPQSQGSAAVLATSDAAIRERTGRGWEEWFDTLDAMGAADLAHREIARWVAGQLDIDPLAWNAQAITMSYERARGGRQVGERADGFTVTASRTVAAPVERLYDAFADPAARAGWLPDAPLAERTATRPKRARYDWGDDGARVHVTFAARDDGRSTISVEHARLRDAAQAAELKAYWRERLGVLASFVAVAGGAARLD